MKKHLLLIATIISTTVFSQKSNSFLDVFKNKVPSNVSMQKVASIINLKDSTYNWNWDYTNGVWGSPNRAIYSYNSFYKENGFLNSYYNSGAWEFIDKELNYTYDSNNNLLEQTNQQWNPSTLSWDDIIKVSNTYDASNNVITKLYQQWNNNTLSWENSFYIISTYDSNNNQLSILNQTWNNTGLFWEDQDKSIATYNSSNEYTSYISLNWNNSSYVWDNASQVINIIYSNGDLISYEDQNWNSVFLTYESIRNEVLTYNSNHKITSSISQSWDTPTNTWINSDKNIYTYDSNDNQITLIYQIWLTTTNTWENNFRSFDYYTSVVGIKKLTTQNEVINVCPNPASNTITLSSANMLFDEVNIVDVTGKTVLLEKINQTNSTKINVNSLQSGVYFISLKNENSSVYKKFIKE